MTAEEFEAAILEILTNPVPKPKFDLWTYTQQGQVVGYFWKSVSYCFDSDGEAAYGDFPGWCYHLSSKDKDGRVYLIKEVEERDIRPLIVS